MKNIFITIGISALLFTACSSNKSEKEVLTSSKALAQFNWLVGNWEDKTDTSLMAEYWSLESDSLMVGVAMYILKGDTNFYEKIRLEKKGNDIFYSPIILGQNADNAIPFKLTMVQDTTFIFENPQHDFPQKVVYERRKPEMLFAYVEGVEEGVFSRSEYLYKKVK